MSKRWDELSAVEQLAVKQALYKVLAEDVSTSKQGNLRARVDETYKGFYHATGGKSYDVNVDGKKVGTISVTVKDAKPTARVYVIDQNGFGDWVRDDDAVGNAAIEWVLADRKRAEAFARYLVEVTGVMPEGCETYADNGTPTLTTSLRIDTHKVADALGNALPSTIAGLLEG